MSDVKIGSNEMAQRELHRKIWAIVDDVRGVVDGWDFKQYILGILFIDLYRRILQSFLTRRNMKRGTWNFNYANITDEEADRDFLDQIR